MRLQVKAAFKRDIDAKAHAALADLIYLVGLPMTLAKSKYLQQCIAAVHRSGAPQLCIAAVHRSSAEADHLPGTILCNFPHYLARSSI
jgi:hypothetical protein